MRKILFIAVLTFTSNANIRAAAEEFCSTESERSAVDTSCSFLMNHVEKRQTQLMDLGYGLELVRDPRHRQHTVTKLTHPDFPKGGFLLVRNPQRKHTSNNNIHESYELSNDILTNDMTKVPTHRERLHLKHKHHSNINKREATFCCEDTTRCMEVNCH